MLYVHLIKKFQPKVRKAVRQLFANAYKHQTDEFDLLLILENGMKDDLLFERNKRVSRSQRISPYIIGPHYQYYAEMTQYDFYDIYRKLNTKNNNRKSYLKKIRGNRSSEAQYSIATQIELMQYLKLFESNRFLERLYKLVQLSNGNNYPWSYQIKKNDSRSKIILNDIRDKSKTKSPLFYNLMKEIYLSQIRNAVAHSQYFILSIDINFLNYEPKKHAPLYFVKIEDWEDRFHKLVSFYNEFIHCLKLYDYIYKRQALNKHFGLPLRALNLDDKEITQWFRYNTDLDRWQTYESWRNSLNIFNIV